MNNSFATRDTLTVGDQSFEIFSLRKLNAAQDIVRLPNTLKILLENLLRNEDERTVTRADIESLIGWNPQAEPDCEIAFRPARVLMQDFTGVPAVVDLAAIQRGPGVGLVYHVGRPGEDEAVAREHHAARADGHAATPRRRIC